jgi:glycosyltransferase involved in cell wall biosynthesis
MSIEVLAIISCYNNEDTIKQSIESLKLIPNKICLIDKGSTDNSKQVGLNCLKKYFARDRIICEGTNEILPLIKSSDWVVSLKGSEVLDEDTRINILHTLTMGYIDYYQYYLFPLEYYNNKNQTLKYLGLLPAQKLLIYKTSEQIYYDSDLNYSSYFHAACLKNSFKFNSPIYMQPKRNNNYLRYLLPNIFNLKNFLKYIYKNYLEIA